MEEFKNVNEILDFAIVNEQKSIDFYTKLAETAVSEEMKKVFIQFAGEEMNHKAKLLKVKETGIMETVSEKITDLKISDYVVNVEIKDDMTYQEALVIAMKREKASFKLYQNLAEKAPNEEMKQLFLMLSQEEAKHKLRFEIEYDEYVLKEN